MAPAVDLSLQGHILPRHQLTATSTIAPLSIAIFTAPFNIRDSPNATNSPTSTPGAVQTSSPNPTSVPPRSAKFTLNPAIKSCLFIFAAFVGLVLFFFVFHTLRKIRKQVIFQRANEQRIRDIEDRRREAALQWQRLERESHAENGRDREMQMRERIMRYAEQVEECEFEYLGNPPLATEDSAQLRGHRSYHAEDQGQREDAEARESSDPTEGDETMTPINAEASRQKSFEREPSITPCSGKTVETSQYSSRTEHDGNSSQPLSSDEVLRAVNALGYESISDSQRAYARARALKDLEGQ